MQVTMISAAILGLLLVLLASRISALRRSGQISLGDGGNAELLLRVRSLANCTEWAPIGLTLFFLAEQAVGASWYVVALAIAFVAGRLMHPLGMKPGIPGPGRILGTVLTYVTVAILALVVFAHAITRCTTCGMV